VPVTNITNMDDIVSINTSRQRLNMLLMTIFGGAALVLAAIGIYGLMAYSVQHRTQEIGIRMALGAQADRVRWSIVGQGMTLVGVGIVAGIVAAFFLATFLAAVLYGVQARRHGLRRRAGRARRDGIRGRLDRGAACEPHSSARGVALRMTARQAAGIDPVKALPKE
jgi:ABC-type antimicrobial peptide transport system permease subunit